MFFFQTSKHNERDCACLLFLHSEPEMLCSVPLFLFEVPFLMWLTDVSETETSLLKGNCYYSLRSIEMQLHLIR